MKFQLTGADFFNGRQTNVEKSLGGYISIDELPSGINGNLFGAISYSMLRTMGNLFEEVRALVLHNDEDVALENLKIYMQAVNPSEFVDFQLAAVDVPSGVEKIEKVFHFRATPVNIGGFVDIVGIDNERLVSASFEAGRYIALWFKRIVILPAEHVLKNPFSDCNALSELNINLEANPICDYRIVLSWD